MALEEQMQQQNPNVLTDEDEQSLEIAVLLGKKLIDEAGAEVIQTALESKDPGQILGQFLLQLGSQMGEQMPEGLEIPPSIMLAKGGWLEQMSDFIHEEYDVPTKVMDRAEIFVASTAQQMAQNKQGGAAQQGAPAPQPQAAQPVLPEGGM